jgi:hypothetical protein
MSNPHTTFWTPATKDSLCPVQDVTAGQLMVFTHPESVGMRFPGFARTISFTSVNDCSGSTLLIHGLCNGLGVTEEVQGPSHNTVESKQIVDAVISIQVLNSDAEGLSAGMGTTGRTAWFLFNYQAMMPDLSAQVILRAGTCTYSLMGTLSNVAQKKEAEIHPFALLNDMKHKEESALAALSLMPLHYVCVQIEKSNGDATLEITLLQQGIT